MKFIVHVKSYDSNSFLFFLRPFCITSTSNYLTARQNHQVGDRPKNIIPGTINNNTNCLSLEFLMLSLKKTDWQILVAEQEKTWIIIILRNNSDMSSCIPTRGGKIPHNMHSHSMFGCSRINEMPWFASLVGIRLTVLSGDWRTIIIIIHKFT